MKYDFVFKLNCTKLYKNGQWPETPAGIGQRILENELLLGENCRYLWN